MGLSLLGGGLPRGSRKEILMGSNAAGVKRLDEMVSVLATQADLLEAEIAKSRIEG